jgi:hypothetical protein
VTVAKGQRSAIQERTVCSSAESSPASHASRRTHITHPHVAVLGGVEVDAAEHPGRVRGDDGVGERTAKLEFLLVPAEVDEDLAYVPGTTGTSA